MFKLVAFFALVAVALASPQPGVLAPVAYGAYPYAAPAYGAYAAPAAVVRAAPLAYPAPLGYAGPLGYSAPLAYAGAPVVKAAYLG